MRLLRQFAVAALLLQAALVGSASAQTFSRGLVTGAGGAAPFVPPTLVPGVSYTGTDGCGGTCGPPALDTSQQGSGFTQTAIGNFDIPPNSPIEAATPVTIIAGIGDRAWISKVRCYLEGSQVDLTRQSINPVTNTKGWVLYIASSATQNGDVTLACDIYPVNGFVRRISTPQWLNTNAGGAGYVTRPVFYVDCGNVTGHASNSNTGTSPTFVSGTTAPWATFHKIPSAGSGAIVYEVSGGTCLEDDNSAGPTALARMIDVRPYIAGGITGYGIGRTARGGWQIKSAKTRFSGATLDTDKISTIQCGGNSVAAPIVTFSNSAFTNPLGATGPAFGYSNAEGDPGALFVTGQGCIYSVTESTMTTVVPGGANLIRNWTGTVGYDAMVTGTDAGGANLNNGFVVANYTPSNPVDYKQRESTLVNPVVASAAINTPIAGQSTITYSGTPGLQTVAEGFVQFQTGALATQKFATISQTSGGSTTVVSDAGGALAGASAGDTVWIYNDAHDDAFQISQDTTANHPNLYNAVFQNYKAVGHYQLTLAQRGQIAGSGTVTIAGTTATFSAAQTFAADDFVVLSNGTQKYQYARVLNATTASTTAALATVPSGGDVSTPATFVQTKTFKDVLFEDCIISGLTGQIQHGEVHWVLVQSDFLYNPATSSVGHYQFRNDTVFGGTNGLGGLALEAFTAFDSIFQDISATGATFPATGTNFDNICAIANVGPSGSPPANCPSLAFDGNFRPTSGLSQTISGTPLFPWDYSGTPIAAGAKIGAMQP